jgi:hypothetical protein
MRELHDHVCDDLNKCIKIEVADEADPKHGGHHKYQIYYHTLGSWGKGCKIEFQNGSPKIYDDKGNVINVNTTGTTNEAVLAVIIDRLRSFQNGKYPCRENAEALRHLEEAMFWLHARSNDRIRRGVEGEFKS